jgi:hypothetical protein
LGKLIDKYLFHYTDSIFQKLCYLNYYKNKFLEYNDLNHISKRFSKVSPNLNNKNNIEKTSISNIILQYTKQNKIFKTSLSELIDNFYITNTINRSSQIMAKCSNLLLKTNW